MGDQSWFWTDEWQAGERAAEADLAAGRHKDFATAEDFLASLNGTADGPAQRR